MEIIKSIKEMIDQKLYGIIFLLAIVFGFKANNYDGDVSIFLELAIGIMAFVGIFYSFIIMKKIKERRDKILTVYWKEHTYPNSINRLRKADKLIKKDPHNRKILDILDKFSDELVTFRSEFEKMDIEWHVLFSILFSICTIISGIFIHLSDKLIFIPYTQISLTGVSIFSLVMALNSVLRLVISWHKILPIETG